MKYAREIKQELNEGRKSFLPVVGMAKGTSSVATCWTGDFLAFLVLSLGLEPSDSEPSSVDHVEYPESRREVC